MQWSYQLLGDAERRVFRAVSVFPGPFTLEAAEAVAGAGAGRWRRPPGLELARQTGIGGLEATALTCLSLAVWHDGDRDGVLRLARQALQISEDMRVRSSAAWARL